jgi:Flp pilus assembly pilin Flp
MSGLFARFVREDTGQDLIEYGLLVGIITAVSAAAIVTIGNTTKGFYTALCTALGTSC